MVETTVALNPVKIKAYCCHQCQDPRHDFERDLLYRENTW